MCDEYIQSPFNHHLWHIKYIKPPFFRLSERLFLTKPEAYLYTEGLVRFCSEAFTLDKTQLCNGCVHLTNNEAAMAIFGSTRVDFGDGRFTKQDTEYIGIK